MGFYETSPFQFSVSAEIDQQAYWQTSGFEVVDDLGFFTSCQSVHRLEFDQNLIETQEVADVNFAQGLAPVMNYQLALGFERNPAQRQLSLHRLLINSLQKPCPQLAMNFNRSTNDGINLLP